MFRYQKLKFEKKYSYILYSKRKIVSSIELKFSDNSRRLSKYITGQWSDLVASLLCYVPDDKLKKSLSQV